MKEGGEGGEEVEVDGRSGLGAGGLVSQRDDRGVWQVETMALIPIVRPRGGESERERGSERRFLLCPMQDKRGSFYKDGGTVEVERRDVHVG